MCHGLTLLEVRFGKNNSKVAKKTYGSDSFESIYNPLFKEKPYDTIGIIDATFKVITSEMFELFKSLWSFKKSSKFKPLLIFFQQCSSGILNKYRIQFQLWKIVYFI